MTCRATDQLARMSHRTANARIVPARTMINRRLVKREMLSRPQDRSKAANSEVITSKRNTGITQKSRKNLPGSIGSFQSSLESCQARQGQANGKKAVSRERNKR